MKKDQANKTNVERVYRWWPLAWEPGPNRSGIDLQLVQEWVRHSCTSCTSTHWSWSGVEAEAVEWMQMWLEVGSRAKWGGGGCVGRPQVGGTECYRWPKKELRVKWGGDLKAGMG